VDRGEVVVLVGGPENFEQGVLFGKSRRNCTAWTGVILQPPPFILHPDS
jgi:hypothetical protein